MSLIYRNWPFWFLLAYKDIDKQGNKKINNEHRALTNVNIQYFHHLVKNAKHIVIFTGTEISQQSDVPELYGKTTLWKGTKITEICGMDFFFKNPFLFWEYINYVRKLCYDKKPNKIHYAIADFQKQMIKDKRKVTIITENVDGLHHKAGSLSVVELCGNIYETICINCNKLRHDVNKLSYLMNSGKQTVDDGRKNSQLTENTSVPKCNCGGTLRPNVWYEENTLTTIVKKAIEAITVCDLILIIGATSKIYMIPNNGSVINNIKTTVIELNHLEKMFPQVIFYFKGDCINLLPEMLESFKYYKTNKQNI